MRPVAAEGVPRHDDQHDGGSRRQPEERLELDDELGVGEHPGGRRIGGRQVEPRREIVARRRDREAAAVTEAEQRRGDDAVEGGAGTGHGEVDQVGDQAGGRGGEEATFAQVRAKAWGQHQQRGADGQHQVGSVEQGQSGETARDGGGSGLPLVGSGHEGGTALGRAGWAHGREGEGDGGQPERDPGRPRVRVDPERDLDDPGGQGRERRGDEPEAAGQGEDRPDEHDVVRDAEQAFGADVLAEDGHRDRDGPDVGRAVEVFEVVVRDLAVEHQFAGDEELPLLHRRTRSPPGAEHERGQDHDHHGDGHACPQPLVVGPPGPCPAGERRPLDRVGDAAAGLSCVASAGHHRGGRRNTRSRMPHQVTRHSSSNMIFGDIFEKPRTRSVNAIGTSAIFPPLRNTR